MNLTTVLRKNFAISRLLGLAPFEIRGQSLHTSRTWQSFAYFVFFFNFLLQGYWCIYSLRSPICNLEFILRFFQVGVKNVDSLLTLLRISWNKHFFCKFVNDINLLKAGYVPRRHVATLRSCCAFLMSFVLVTSLAGGVANIASVVLRYKPSLRYVFLHFSSTFIRASTVSSLSAQFIICVLFIGLCCSGLNNHLMQKENICIYKLKSLMFFDDILKSFSELIADVYSLQNLTVTLLTWFEFVYIFGFSLLTSYNLQPSVHRILDCVTFFLLSVAASMYTTYQVMTVVYNLF